MEDLKRMGINRPMSEKRIKLMHRLCLILARNRSATTYTELRRKAEHHIRSIGMSESDFMNFLQKLVDTQVLLEIITRGKVHYELFNKATMEQLEDQRKEKDEDRLLQQYPELVRAARKVKAQRLRNQLDSADDSEIPTVLSNPVIPTKYEPQKEVLSNDPEGFGVKTRRTL